MKALNWKEDLDEVLLAMGTAEGDAWVLDQLWWFENDGKDGLDASEHTVVGVTKWLNKVLLEDPDYAEGTDLMGDVYGDGGFDRYFFYGNGEVKFSRSHAMTEGHHRRAFEAGIKCF